MHYEVVGFRPCQGVSKKTNRPYKGYFVFLTIERVGVQGKATENIFVGEELGYIPVIGDRVRLDYNARGFLVGVESV